MTNKISHIYQEPSFGEDWFSYPKLYEYVTDKYPEGSTFVEVGSWKGKSSAFMAVEIANSGKCINFFCVDTWEGSAEHTAEQKNDLYYTFLYNMKDLKHLYSSYKMPSVDAALLFNNESLEFVFIDASHEYEDVLANIKAWLPKIKKGGMIAGHDYSETWPGVCRAVKESFEDFFINEGCWAVQRPE